MKKSLIILGLLISFSSVHAKFLAISTMPINLAAGMSNAAVDIGLFAGFAVGGEALTWSPTIEEYDYTISYTSLRIHYFFGGEAYSQGAYLVAKAYSMNLEVTTEILDVEYTATQTATATGVGVGYHWQWDYFFQQLGLEAVTAATSDIITLENEDGDEVELDGAASTGSGVGLIYTLGWAF